MAGSPSPDNPVPDWQPDDWQVADDQPRPPWRLDRPAAAILLLVGAWFVFLVGAWSGRHSARPPVIGPFTPPATAVVDTVAVDVGGDVARPGLYRLPANARVKDALDRAGGALPDADLSKLNQAAWVEDGAKIVVPAAGDPTEAAIEPAATTDPTVSASADETRDAAPAADAEAVVAPADTYPRRRRSTGKGSRGKGKRDSAQLAAHPIDLNRAGADDLMALPGVGPKMADKIVAYRQANGPLTSVDDLRKVPGIGPKRMDALRPLVTVR